MTVYLELGDYCEIAAELLGTTSEQIARLPRIGLADSALATPSAGFGDHDAYPSLIEKAAVLVEHLARNHPLPDGSKRAAFALEGAPSRGDPVRVAVHGSQRPTLHRGRSRYRRADGGADRRRRGDPRGDR